MFTLLRGLYQEKNRAQLRTIPVPPRGNRSQIWMGVQHGELIDRICEVLKSEWSVTPAEEQYCVSPTGSVLLGSFQLRQDGILMSAPDARDQMNYCFGVRHSNDSRFAVTGVAGASVMICQNGMIMGEEKWKSKHTKGFNIRDFIRRGLQRFFEKLPLLNRAAKLFAESHVVTASVFDSTLLSLARHDILPWRLLGELDALWQNSDDNPNFCGDSIWDWYNTLTEVAKQLPPMAQFTTLSRGFELGTQMLPPPQRQLLLT